MFDNAIGHSIYAKDALQVARINKRSEGQQPFLWLDWYMAHDRKVISQEMSTMVVNLSTSQSSIMQKGI